MKHESISRSHTIILLLLITILAGGCSRADPGVHIPALETPTQNDNASPIFQVFFTDPTAPGARYYEGGPDQYLAEAIDDARYNIDVAIYSLNLWNIRDALIHASRRGMAVRMVMESGNMDNLEVQDLLDAGIPILGDRHEGLMHNKFIVIDRDEVWTGSMNFTVGSAYRDNNNLLRIRSVKVAEIYTREFNQMFENDLFGQDRGMSEPPPVLMLGDTRMETYFSPENAAADRIVDLLRGARESIRFLAYSFTSDDIGAMVIERAQAGISVAGVMDSSQILSNSGTEYDKFIRAGLAVRRDGNEGLMHHKVIIIDKQIVITGSYNFSRSAEVTNDENVVIVFDRDLASLYLQEFQKIYDQAQP
jgi:phosphatidylserine/phosphatidylglycerophosphate/cardiolipin synthase-like enzyme